VEYSITVLSCDRIAEHTLRVTSIQLKKCRVLPIAPVGLLEQFATGELHRFCNAISDIAIVNMFIVASDAKVLCGVGKVPAIVELIVHVLGERSAGNDW
jgi:hypothetical protein